MTHLERDETCVVVKPKTTDEEWTFVETTDEKWTIVELETTDEEEWIDVKSAHSVTGEGGMMCVEQKQVHLNCTECFQEKGFYNDTIGTYTLPVICPDDCRRPVCARCYDNLKMSGFTCQKCGCTLN